MYDFPIAFTQRNEIIFSQTNFSQHHLIVNSGEEKTRIINQQA